MLIDIDDPNGNKFTQAVTEITDEMSEEDCDHMVASLVRSFHFDLPFAKQVVDGSVQVNLFLQDLVLRWMRGAKHGAWVRKNFGTHTA